MRSRRMPGILLLGTAKHIVGSFRPGQKRPAYFMNPELAVVNMISAPDGFYQSAVNLDYPLHRLTERFDIVIGSGRHGQTYLYWDGELGLRIAGSSYWTWNHVMGHQPGISCRGGPL